MTLDLEFMMRTFLLASAGIPVTLMITVVTLLLSFPAAFFMAISRIHRIKGLKVISSVYVSLIRGTPMVLQILLVYSLLPSLLNSLFKSAGLDIDIFGINPIVYAYAVFTFNTTASLSEVFRSALQTVDIGQMEAALSTGLSSFQSYRRIIIPQALVSAIPNICNVTINLIKGTSLAFIMTVKDITAIAKVEAAYGYNYIEAYIVVFLLYIIVCSATQQLFKLIENSFNVNSHIPAKEVG